MMCFIFEKFLLGFSINPLSLDQLFHSINPHRNISCTHNLIAMASIICTCVYCTIMFMGYTLLKCPLTWQALISTEHLTTRTRPPITKGIGLQLFLLLVPQKLTRMISIFDFEFWISSSPNQVLYYYCIVFWCKL